MPTPSWRATATSSAASSSARRTDSVTRFARVWCCSTTWLPQARRRSPGRPRSTSTTRWASRSSSRARSQASGASKSMSPDSRRRWSSSDGGPGRRRPARRLQVPARRRTASCSTSSAPPSSWVTPSTRARRACSRSWATSCSSTARRSTPRAGDRWETPARFSPRAGRPTCSTRPTRCPG